MLNISLMEIPLVVSVLPRDSLRETGTDDVDGGIESAGRTCISHDGMGHELIVFELRIGCLDKRERPS